MNSHETPEGLEAEQNWKEPEESTTELERRELWRGNVEITVSSREPDEEERKRTKSLDVPSKISDITLRSKQEGTAVRLNDFMPEGWLMAQTERNPSLFPDIEARLVARPKTKLVAYPRTVLIPRLSFLAQKRHLEARTPESKTSSSSLYEAVPFETHDFLKMRGAFLGLLHEMGHSQQAEISDSELIEEMFLRARGSIASREGGKGILEAEPADIEKYIDVVIQNERNAWASALRTYRNLLKQGIDVEPDMDLKEIFSHIKDALHSYHPTSEPAELDRIRRAKMAREASQEKT